VQLFFIDTNPFIAAFQTASWAKYDGGILQQSWEEQLRELEQRLAKSTAPWKLMVRAGMHTYCSRSWDTPSSRCAPRRAHPP
jgi:hypothetical protein